MSSTPQIRPLNNNDINIVMYSLVYGSIRGYAIEQENIVIGVVGVMYTSPIQAFSTIVDPVLKKFPKVIMKAARLMTPLFDNIEAPVYAIADEEHLNSANFLSHIGFKYLKQTNRGQLYVWVPKVT